MLTAIFVIVLLIFCVKAVETALAIFRWVEKKPTAQERKNRVEARKEKAKREALMMEVDGYVG